jgi:hypothetical protein
MATENEDLDPVLRRHVDQLQDREPDIDLWPGISQRIATPQPGWLNIRWPVAAAAAAVLILGSSLATMLVVGGSPGDPAVSAPVASAPGSPTGSQLALPAGYQEAATSLDGAITTLETVIAEVFPGLDVETRTGIEEALGSLDEAIRDARLRTDASPDDVEAARYLTRTMRRKLRVLNTVATMTAT